MLEYLVLAGGCVALVVGVFRLTHRRSISHREGTSFSSFTGSSFTGSSLESADDPDDYVPDTGELTRQMVRAMLYLGHSSITHPKRALAPHLHVEGAAADISAIVDFHDAILADIEAFVRANRKRYRWTLTEKLTLTQSITPHGTPGVLRITRARPPHIPVASGGTSIVQRPPAPAFTGIAPTSTADSQSPFAPTKDLRVVPTRWLGADNAEAVRPAAGAARLFRVGGGNVYRLRPGVNVAGHDPARCDIVLGFDDAVSAMHAEFVMIDENAVTVRDLGSSSGTLIADTPVTHKAVQLAHGDVLTIGATRLRFVDRNFPLLPTANPAGGG
jgi:FHA domain